MHPQVNNMAGRIKHMERSHRSVSKKNNEGTYTPFRRKAYSISYAKQRKMTLGESLAKLLRRALLAKAN